MGRRRGRWRDSVPDFTRFLHVALRSVSELDYQLQLAHVLRYVDEDSYTELAANTTSVERMFASLIRTILQRPRTAN